MSIYFKDNIKPDYGWHSPKRTSKPCSNPDFADKHLHRLAIVKDEHFGAKGDRDENGMSGWVSKLVCNGCGRKFKGYFHPDGKNRNRCKKRTRT